jgi:CMP-N,N'-diacetyllegionaminic acid synthase
MVGCWEARRLCERARHQQTVITPGILALIPARGGSKRLPGKNVRPLGGRPLIVWSIDAARDIPEICDTLVSTDDPEIAKVAANAGAFVPWLRPPELASDTAQSVDVALHALAWYEDARGPVDGLLLLQPTSPFRTRDSILRGIHLFKNGGGAPVLGVSPNNVHPLRTFRLQDGFLVSLASEHGGRQDLICSAPEYVTNGAFYLVTPEHLRSQRSFIGKRTLPLIIDAAEESLDIDTTFDFSVAECIACRAGG